MLGWRFFLFVACHSWFMGFQLDGDPFAAVVSMAFLAMTWVTAADP